MNHEQHSFSTSKKSQPLEVNLDEFMISEESFKPMTKGLGFHHDQKRPSFKPAPKEVKVFGAQSSAAFKPNVTATLNTLNSSTMAKASAHVPTGLEAFYGQSSTSSQAQNNLVIGQPEEVKPVKINYKTAPLFTQFAAWITDLLVIASFVAITGALLVLASGIELKMYSRLISFKDLIAFSAAIFSIYYLLYFTILDLSASPGKTMMGLRVVRNDGKSLSVKYTFNRALISLLSAIALFLPLVLDFQGRLSETKVVK